MLASQPWGVWEVILQPVDFLSMRECKDELVHDAVHADRSTDQLEYRIIRVIPYEMIRIEIRQALATDASGHLEVMLAIVCDHTTNYLTVGM